MFYPRPQQNKKKWLRGTGPLRHFPELVGAGMDRNWQRWDAALATRFGLDRGPCVKYDMVRMNRAAQSVEHIAPGRFTLTSNAGHSTSRNNGSIAVMVLEHFDNGHGERKQTKK